VERRRGLVRSEGDSAALAASRTRLRAEWAGEERCCTSGEEIPKETGLFLALKQSWRQV